MNATKDEDESVSPEVWSFGRSFGRFVRGLRRGRGQSQEVLAQYAGLSADTIRRLEHGGFSPSLDTLRKLCCGLDLTLSTLFECFAIGEPQPAAECFDLLRGRSDTDIELLTQIARALFDELDAGHVVRPLTVDQQCEVDRFGPHAKRLREARRLTQDDLAARSDLAADTIRRLEHVEFSPSLRTLRKLCTGLDLSLSALFNSLELSEQSAELSRIAAMLAGRSDADLDIVERVLNKLLDGLDIRRSRGPDHESP